jgi:hypothetical protein
VAISKIHTELDVCKFSVSQLDDSSILYALFSMLMNTGTDIMLSQHGLLTTACFQLGRDQPVFYAIEVSYLVVIELFFVASLGNLN